MKFEKLDNLVELKQGSSFLTKDKLLPSGLYPAYIGGKDLSGYWNDYNQEDKITIIAAGVPSGYINLIHSKFWLGNNCLYFELKTKDLIYKYLFYFLKSKEAIIQKNRNEGAIFYLNRPFLKSIPIPLPSLETQQKIVSFLDLLQKQIALRERELREKQFNFYLNRIFKNIKADGINLKELIKINKGNQLNKELIKELPDKENIFPVINGSKTLIGYWKESNVKGQTITIAQGGQAGWIEWQPSPFYAGGHCFCLELLNQNLLNRFLYFAAKYKQKELLNKAIGVTIKGITKDDVYSLKIPLLPLKEQQKISKDLDKLHSLTFDFLPKEIGLRKQQFQYYLNQIFLHLK